MKRLMISATGSNSGKTLFTCGLLQVLINRKIIPSAFKCGPDYIDPMFHTKITGSYSTNLDSFFCEKEQLLQRLKENSHGTDIAILEGVMGYYDGVDGTTTMASAYEIAKLTDTFVLLLVNAEGMSLSVVPLLLGFLSYQKDSKIKGIVLNKVSAMLYPRLKKVIEEQLNIPVYGYIPVLKEMHISSRHLGLLLPEEIKDLKEQIQRLGERLEETIDIDGLLSLAEEAKDMSELTEALALNVEKVIPTCTIAVARDEAFCFIYRDNIRFLEEAGAKLVYFSPLHDAHLPQGIQGLILYGGYPELYAKQLSENVSMRKDIYEKVINKLPLLAECGGFMYLHQEIKDIDQQLYPMVSIIPAQTWNQGKLKQFGYITLEEFTAFGETIRHTKAHEFHYYDSNQPGEGARAVKPISNRSWNCLHTSSSMVIGFPHFYYYGSPDLANSFLAACRSYQL